MIKQCFKILVILPEYSMDVQAGVFPALVAIHNCILERDPIEIADILPPSDNGIDVEDCGQFNILEYIVSLPHKSQYRIQKSQSTKCS